MAKLIKLLHYNHLYIPKTPTEPECDISLSLPLIGHVKDLYLSKCTATTLKFLSVYLEKFISFTKPFFHTHQQFKQSNFKSNLISPSLSKVSFYICDNIIPDIYNKKIKKSTS